MDSKKLALSQPLVSIPPYRGNFLEYLEKKQKPKPKNEKEAVLFLRNMKNNVNAQKDKMEAILGTPKEKPTKK